MIFRSHPDVQQKTKQTVQNTPGNIIAVNKGVLMLDGECPWSGHARDQKEEKGEKERSQLESLKGKVEILEIFKGSSTPEGQRPGEF